MPFFSFVFSEPFVIFLFCFVLLCYVLYCIVDLPFPFSQSGTPVTGSFVSAFVPRRHNCFFSLLVALRPLCSSLSNSVLQALYFCQPFRHQVLQFLTDHPDLKGTESLLAALAVLFVCLEPFRIMVLHFTLFLVCFKGQIAHSQKRTGIIQPEQFVRRLKIQNGSFTFSLFQLPLVSLLFVFLPHCRGISQRRSSRCTGLLVQYFLSYSSPLLFFCQEFLNYLLNQISEEWKANISASSSSSSSPSASGTFIESLFQGTLVNETECLRCGDIKWREEKFLICPWK